MRIPCHPILNGYETVRKNTVTITVNQEKFIVPAGETVAAALMANGIKIFRHTRKNHQPRGLFCGIGQCHDCAMTIDGVPNVRTCITPVRDGMKIET